MLKQSQELSNIPHIIICTPGRLVHQLKHDQAKLSEYFENLQFIVFDEADRILTNESFEDDLNFIMNSIPSQHETRDIKGNGRQTFLFSATMSSNYDQYVSKEILFGHDFNPK